MARKPQVVATTNIVADVVSQVGGDRIDLTALLPVGADPHAYQPTPNDLRSLNEADIIFVNDLHLEETLAGVLENLDRPVSTVSVNDGVATIEFVGGNHASADTQATDARTAADHGVADPHTWMNVGNVEQWVANIEIALAEIDPINATAYQDAAARYRQTLVALDAEIRDLVETIPPERRRFVTDHDNMAYFADAYGFEVVGSVIPSLSTMAAASAQELSALQVQMEQEKVEVILVGTTVNPKVAEQLARDVGAQVVSIYVGSLSKANGPAPTYVAMLRYNVEALVAALTSVR